MDSIHFRAAIKPQFLAEHNRMLGWMWNERVCFLVVVLRLSAATR